jgi:hypothetical protein
MMTAAHCSASGTSVTIPGNPGPTGTFGNQLSLTCRDTALHSYPAGIDSTIYTGPFDSSSVSNARIAGATPDFIGNLVVAGGASSGEHFNIRVGEVDAFKSVGGIPCDPVGPLTVANSVDNSCATAPGDSGGPVYSYQSDGRVLVRGTVTGGNSGVPCPGNVSTGGFQVFWAPLVRPPGGPEVGSLGIYSAVVLGVPNIDLNGAWADSTNRGPAVISVQAPARVGQAITVDMSRFNRPTAHGTITDERHISVTFPDAGTFTATLLESGTIFWSNNTIWTKR